MKHLLLLPAMLLTSAMTFAQLYVTPNTTANTDSFVYVDDQVLFVEQDINLVENDNDVNTEASIYLRNQSQLVQGTTGSANQGTGFISVIQDSYSDAYDYNFWSSPVGHVTASSSASGNINFGILAVSDSINLTRGQETAITSGHNGWDHGTNLTISQRWLYKKPGATWTSIYTNDNVAPGYGFTMKGTNVTTIADGTTITLDANNQKYDFRGRPHNGDITITSFTGSATLMGNPYPSALDLNRFFFDMDENGVSTNNNTEILSIRFWDEDRSINSHLFTDNKGGYGTWTPDGPDASGTNSGTYVKPVFLNYDQAGGDIGSAGYDPNDIAYAERRFAPIGQGFQVLAQDGGVGISGPDPTANQMVISNKHRRYIKEGLSNNSQFRSATGNGPITADSDAGSNTENANQTPRIRIYTTFGESHFRDMVLNFNENTTDFFDWGYDGPHPMDATLAEAYMPVGPDNDRNPMVIQAIPYADSKKVPIAFSLEHEFKFAVQVVEEVNLPFSVAYLYDSDNNSYKKITGGDEAVQTLPAGTYENRFFIVFKAQSAVNDDDPTLIAAQQIGRSMEFFQNNPQAQLEIGNPDGYDIKVANIFDMSGKLVLTQNNIGKVANYSFPTGNLSDGVYLVKLTTADNVTVDYKISVFNKN